MAPIATPPPPQTFPDQLHIGNKTEVENVDSGHVYYLIPSPVSEMIPCAR